MPRIEAAKFGDINVVIEDSKTLKDPLTGKPMKKILFTNTQDATLISDFLNRYLPDDIKLNLNLKVQHDSSEKPCIVMSSEKVSAIYDIIRSKKVLEGLGDGDAARLEQLRPK